MDDQERLEKIEKRIEEFSIRIEAITDRLGQNIDNKVSEKLENADGRIKIKFDEDNHRDSGSGRIFWGLAFVVGGTIWLGNQMEWFDIDIPIGAAAIILVGLYLIVAGRRR